VIDQSSLKMTNKSSILVICGPTASGKTSLSLEIAKLLPKANILSADSRQIYQGLDIVTGKDIPADLPPNISFFGLDLVEPNQAYNLADFVSYSQKIIQSSIKENVPLIIVGGTGLYLKAITSDLLNVHVPPNIDLRRDLERLDLKTLQSRLLELNPNKLASLNNSDLHNPRRLIRAIEISSSLRDSTSIDTPLEGTNQSNPSSLDRHASLTMTDISFLWIGLHQDKEIQKAKIRQRVLDRLDYGAIEEVENLMIKYPNHRPPIFTSLGVQETSKFLHQEITRETLIHLWTASEIAYARRQMVWFKKQPGIVWYDKSTIDSHLIAKLTEIYK